MSDLLWHTSTYSDPPNGGCVEVAETLAVTHVRDTKDRTLPGFTFRNEAWTTFVEYAKEQRV